MQNYGDPDQVRNCYLVGLNDLDGAQSHVQDVQAKYMNDLINIGVAGKQFSFQDLNFENQIVTVADNWVWSKDE